MSEFRDHLLLKMAMLGRPIDNLTIDFSGHVPTILRKLADQIEENEIQVRRAIISSRADAPDLQNIDLVTTTKHSP